MADDSGRVQTDLTLRLDRLPWLTTHSFVVLILGIGRTFDSMGVAIIGNVIAIMIVKWQLSAVEASLATSVWLLGVLFGSLFLGQLADYIGRKPTFMITGLLYFISSFIAGLSPHYAFFLVFHFFAACAIGGEVTVLTTSIAEFVPPRVRGRVSALFMTSWPLGAFLAALSVLLVLKASPLDWAWRLSFWVTPTLLLLSLWGRLKVPESVRWLISHGRLQEAERIVLFLEHKAREEKGDALPPLDANAKIALSTNRIRFVLQAREVIVKYPGPLLTVMFCNLAEVGGYYGLSVLLSTVLLPRLNVPPQEIPYYYLFANVFGIVGGIVVVSVIDSMGRKIALLSSYLAATLSVAFVALSTDNQASLMVGYVVSVLTYNCAWITLLVVTGEIFPTHVRGTAAGLSHAFGRIGGIISAPIAASIFTATNSAPYAVGFLTMFWALGAVAAVYWFAVGREGKHQSLEDMVPAESLSTRGKEKR